MIYNNRYLHVGHHRLNLAGELTDEGIIIMDGNVRNEIAGGHLKSTTVLYTVEIALRPTVGGSIGRKFDSETGTGFWDFK